MDHRRPPTRRWAIHRREAWIKPLSKFALFSITSDWLTIIHEANDYTRCRTFGIPATCGVVVSLWLRMNHDGVDGSAEVLVVVRCPRADSVDKVRTNLLRRERTKEGCRGECSTWFPTHLLNFFLCKPQTDIRSCFNLEACSPLRSSFSQ